MSHDHRHGHDHEHEHTHHHSHSHRVPWNDRTAQWYEPSWSDPLLRRAIEAAELGSSDVVVEAGGGDGASLHAAAAWVTRGRLAGVVGADQLAAAQAAAAAHPDAERLTVHAGVPEALPLDAGIASVAWSIRALSGWSEPSRCIAELHRVLRPGGRLLIAAEASACGIGEDPTNPASLKALLRSAGFRAVEVRRYRDAEVRSVLFMASRGR